METKFTKGNLYPVEYAGRWDIQDGEFYGDDSVLDAESVGEETAEANAKLFAAAPDLLNDLIHACALLKNTHPNNVKMFEKTIKKATE